MANALDYALLKVERKPPGRHAIYSTLLYTSKYSSGNWGDALLTGISGNSDGTAELSFTDLTGVTITSYEGTGPAPNIVGNSIIFPSGSYWDIQLSDGTYIPDPNSGYNVAGTGQNATPSNFTEDIESGGTMYFYEYGFNLDGGMVPASQDDPTKDVLGNDIDYPPVPQGINLASGLIDYTNVQDNDIYNKNAYVGNPYGLPEIWNAGTTWEYTDDPLKWKAEEKTMEYLYDRMTPAYKNTLFTTEVYDAEGNFIGIAREEYFDGQLSDDDASLLNEINNGTSTLP
jgi:hypothetical protein